MNKMPVIPAFFVPFKMIEKISSIYLQVKNIGIYLQRF
jgi:hypothetical protein